MTNQYVFKISIPLLKTKKFKLFSINSIPAIKNEKYLWISSEHKYLLTAVDRQIYQYVDNLNNCYQYKDKTTLICSMPTQWFTASKSSCGWNVFNHISHEGCNVSEKAPEIFFLSLNENTFIFVLKNAIKVTIVCGESIVHKTLAGEGMLSLNSQCVLNSDKIQLVSKSNFGESDSEVVIPELDLRTWYLPETNETNEMKLLNATDTEMMQITKLKQDIQINRENQNLIKRRALDFHDIHHYVSTYFIIIIIALYFYFKRLRNRTNSTVNTGINNDRTNNIVNTETNSNKANNSVNNGRNDQNTAESSSNIVKMPKVAGQNVDNDINDE